MDCPQRRLSHQDYTESWDKTLHWEVSIFILSEQPRDQQYQIHRSGQLHKIPDVHRSTLQDTQQYRFWKTIAPKNVRPSLLGFWHLLYTASYLSQSPTAPYTRIIRPIWGLLRKHLNKMLPKVVHKLGGKKSSFEKETNKVMQLVILGLTHTSRSDCSLLMIMSVLRLWYFQSLCHEKREIHYWSLHLVGDSKHKGGTFSNVQGNTHKLYSKSGWSLSESKSLFWFCTHKTI